MVHILVVDDNKTNLAIVKETLAEKYQVTPVISGAQALRFLEKKRPDLILLDVNMPQMNGKEVLNEIRKNPDLLDIPVIFLTADDTSETERECLSLGAQDYLLKPFVPDIMMEKIELALEKIQDENKNALDKKDIFARTELLLGGDAVEKLAMARVAVFGIGGVGGYATEALARGGIGSLDLFDGDKVSISNINRQIIALTDTIGRFKAEVMRDRIAKINPYANVQAYNVFFMPDNSADYDFSHYDYIIDAVDNVTAKIEIITRAASMNIPVISSMGAGNKLDPTRLEVADIYKTSVCPLARVMRSELRKRGVEKLKTVFSTELPHDVPQSFDGHRLAPGSVSFVPSVAGLIIAGEVIKDISGVR